MIANATISASDQTTAATAFVLGGMRQLLADGVAAAVLVDALMAAIEVLLADAPAEDAGALH